MNCTTCGTAILQGFRSVVAGRRVCPKCFRAHDKQFRTTTIIQPAKGKRKRRSAEQIANDANAFRDALISLQREPSKVETEQFELPLAVPKAKPKRLLRRRTKSGIVELTGQGEPAKYKGYWYKPGSCCDISGECSICGHPVVYLRFPDRCHRCAQKAEKDWQEKQKIRQQIVRKILLEKPPRLEHFVRNMQEAGKEADRIVDSQKDLRQEVLSSILKWETEVLPAILEREAAVRAAIQAANGARIARTGFCVMFSTAKGEFKYFVEDCIGAIVAGPFASKREADQVVEERAKEPSHAVC